MAPVRSAALIVLAAALHARGAHSLAWNCSDTPSECNTCGRCCYDYLNQAGGAACSGCVEQHCYSEFKCSGDSCSAVCPGCCSNYIPNGPSCESCVSQECYGNATAAPGPPVDTAVWTCTANHTVCNTCSECCHDYVPHGPPCDDCVNKFCTGWVCSAGTCNVCSECCHDYIANGTDCNSCVRQRCRITTMPGYTPPPPGPAPAKDSGGWSCVAETTDCRATNSCKCNACDKCCREYVPQGEKCKMCVEQECQFVCSEVKDGPKCNVCAECCEGYIPNGQQCDSCVREKCFGHSAAKPVTTPAPAAGSDGWTCGVESGTCNACSKCCQKYVDEGKLCSNCANECEFSCSGGPCANACPECCQPYIPNGNMCTLCVKQQCTNEEPDPVPEESLATPPSASPTVVTDGPYPAGSPMAKQAAAGGDDSDDGGGSSNTGMIIAIVAGAGTLLLAAGIFVLRRKKVISRHRGAGPRRRKQMSKLEDMQMAELEREAARRDGDDMRYPYTRSDDLDMAD